MNETFNNIQEAIEDLKQGKIIIVVDDEDRENEGDFVMIAELATPETINFMAKEGRGLICVSINEKLAEDLDLKLMVNNNTSYLSTNFTISVDHLPTNTTGISAFDRANTIKALTDDKSKPQDFMRPGHIFPLIARQGGVLRRAGHTEASSDLAKLAGYKPVGVLCEIMNDDGSMARVLDLWKISEKHNMKMITIKDLIQYKVNKEIFVRIDSSVKVPTKWGEFQLFTFLNKHDPKEHHIALVKGNINTNEPVLLRVHSECLTGDVFGSGRCDCGEQLDFAMQKISEEGHGALLYLRQEGRGIGFQAKMKSYELQEKGLDTVEANLKLGFKADLRDYGFGAQMIHLLGIKKIRLMTNNPKKIVGLNGFDIEVVEQIKIEIPVKSTNLHYLETKRDKMGHDILKSSS